MASNMVKVLDHGFVELVDSYGDDLRIVNAARASFNRRHEVMEEGDDKLINFLVKHKHGTPLEMVDFTFLVKAPIAVAREWFRHRIGSYNEVSGRYVKLAPEFYVPRGDNIRKQQGKAGRYWYVPLGDTEKEIKVEHALQRHYDETYQLYENLIRLGVAKEQARLVLPVGMYTQFYFKTNLRALFNFLSLRNDKKAMYEIRVYAEAMEKTVEQVVPIAYKAFVSNGRITP